MLHNNYLQYYGKSEGNVLESDLSFGLVIEGILRNISESAAPARGEIERDFYDAVLEFLGKIKNEASSIGEYKSEFKEKYKRFKNVSLSSAIEGGLDYDELLMELKNVVEDYQK